MTKTKTENSKMKFTAAGDMLIQRKISTEYEGFDEIKKYICKGETRFFNLETTLHNGEFFGNQFYGGSYIHADPSILSIPRAYGFNMLSFANNHTMDFSHNGLLATLNAVNAAGFPNAGVGKNLDDAAAPAYLDTKESRVALISTVSTMSNVAAMAGKQSRRIPGRPGVNGLRFDEKIEVEPEDFEAIRRIAEKSGVNAKDNISRAEGYKASLPEEVTAIQDIQFVASTETRYRTSPNKTDMARIEKEIFEAQMQADYIIVSIHAHEVGGLSKETPPEFLTEFAHRCIDAGAHAVIGHGPHLIRPLEIYKNRPIFYSLGDFMLHNENMPKAAEDMYERYGLTSDATLRELFSTRSNNYTRGLLTDRRMFESYIPYFEMEDGKLTKLELLPIELNFDAPRWRCGNPRPGTDFGILERLGEMSAPLGTKININRQGIGTVEL